MDEERISLDVCTWYRYKKHIAKTCIIGSARAKGSSTSQALSELARRREEKNRVRSKRGRNEVSSIQDSRKRRKRYEDQSDYEYSADESPASEDDAEEKVTNFVYIHLNKPTQFLG
jgi:hypothetical protein